MKIEVGQFVRTDKVGIKKIYEIDNNKTKYKYLYKLKKQDDDGCIDLGALCENNIIKEPSFNVIDVLEVGDYVNGFKVIDIVENDIYISDFYAENYIGMVKVKDIKSVVTKEQMEQMEYKVV